MFLPRPFRCAFKPPDDRILRIIWNRRRLIPHNAFAFGDSPGRNSAPVQRRLPIVFAAALILTACQRHETLVASGTRDQILLIGNKDEPADLDPNFNQASSTGQILSALFQGLVTMSSNGHTVLPGMAERWEVSGDGLTYTFHLRADGRWSNGEPLTAADFRDTFMRILDPQLGCEDAGYAFSIRGARDFAEGRTADPASVGIRVPDSRTLVFQLVHPAPYLLMVISSFPFYPVYMPSLDGQGGRHQRGGPWTRPGVLVSNGPFTLGEWAPNAYVRVVRNPRFWDAGRVRLREIRFYPTDDENSEELAFRAGQLHITARLPQTKVAVYEAAHPEELHVNPILRTNYLTFNLSRPPFADPRIRRAFSLAIDRERLVRAALGRVASAAHAMVRPGLGGYSPPRGFPFDPGEARKLLAEAGYPGGTGLPRIELTLNGNTGVTLEVGEVLQQMWMENLGIRVAVVPVEFKVYLSTLREKQFQLLMDSWLPLPDASDILSLGVTSDPNNDSGASNRDYDAAFAASERTADPRVRSGAFSTMERINAREVFYAPIYYTNQAYLVQTNVHGWRDNPDEWIDWRELYLAP